ncbi:MAG: transcription initiation protein [Solirubrobacterales bacterium]|nr:transcription initiation protein [Solirubrobacterales bacterium]
MPQYMLLIYQPVENPLSPEQRRDEGPRWDEFTETLKNAGALVAGDALERPEVATTVRERDGHTQFTDGPFAETKEFLAGYYLVGCPDLDTALEHAARMPNVGYGSVEVRPVWDRSGPPATSREQIARARA